MGMFDYVIWNDTQYQTKSLDRKMDHYRVNADGQLCKRIWGEIDAAVDYEALSYTGTIYVLDDNTENCFDEYALLFVNGKLLIHFRVKWSVERQKYVPLKVDANDQT